MSLNKNEKLLVEAIKSMLDDDTQLGLSIHKKEDSSAERGYEYLHNTINNMFETKAADLVHCDGVCQAFSKVHNYKYIDDPTFKTAMIKEMVAQAVPGKERDKALEFVDTVIKEMKSDGNWAEKDSGFNPDLDEIKEASQPEQPMDFEIHEPRDNKGYNKSNMKWDKGDASPSRTP